MIGDNMLVSFVFKAPINTQKRSYEKFNLDFTHVSGYFRGLFAGERIYV